jgi:UBX domain-containing protein 1/4
LQRVEAEKVDNVAREKARRFMGKEMSKTREQMEMEQRKRDALARKKEKEAAKRERERIRAEIEKDKLERKSRGGKLSSRLGVDGYNPDGIQYELEDDKAVDGAAAAATPPKQPPKISTAKIDEYINKVSSYRAGGDGLKTLKILKIYVSNVVDNPSEAKFKSINMENNAFKTKVKPFIGAKALLMAVGFSPNEEGTTLVLNDDADPHVLADTKAKLEAAMAKY